MRTIEISEVAALAPLLQSGNQEPLILTQEGQTIAAIVPANQEEVESLLLSINPQFEAVLERSQQRLETEGAVSSDEVRRLLGIDPRNNKARGL